MKEVALLLVVFFLMGCVSWESASWTPETPAIAKGGSTTVSSIETLQLRAASIIDEEGLEDSIDAFQLFVREHPQHREALVTLANHWLLMGTAYAKNRKEKRKAFLEAMRLSEAAMQTDRGFSERSRSGEMPWEACDELGEEHMDAMLFWATGVLYMFREGMVFPQHVAHMEWLDRADLMIEHMKSIDQNWNGGAVLFSQAIVYHAVPPAAGGDPEKAKTYLEEALAVDGDWMLSRWGRAKYFLTAPEDREARIADLNAVLAADSTAGGEAPYWRHYFQTEARRMLEEMDAAGAAKDNLAVDALP